MSFMMNRPLVIGVCGGIGSGKTTRCQHVVAALSMASLQRSFLQGGVVAPGAFDPPDHIPLKWNARWWLSPGEQESHSREVRCRILDSPPETFIRQANDEATCARRVFTSPFLPVDAVAPGPLLIRACHISADAIGHQLYEYKTADEQVTAPGAFSTATDTHRDAVERNRTNNAEVEEIFQELETSFGRTIFAPIATSASSSSSGTAVHPSTHTIDRRALGGIVFKDPAAMSQLNRITWPRIVARVNREINFFASDPRRPVPMDESVNELDVVVLEAALLLEMADMANACDAIALVTASREAAVARVMQRNQLPREEAERRFDAQPSADDRLATLRRWQQDGEHRRFAVIATTGHGTPEEGARASLGEFVGLLSDTFAAAHVVF